jgi:hypothetical protein
MARLFPGHCLGASDLHALLGRNVPIWVTGRLAPVFRVRWFIECFLVRVETT